MLLKHLLFQLSALW